MSHPSDSTQGVLNALEEVESPKFSSPRAPCSLTNTPTIPLENKASDLQEQEPQILYPKKNPYPNLNNI